MPAERAIGVLIAGAIRHAADYAPLIAGHQRMHLAGVAEAADAAPWQRERARALAAEHELPCEELDVALRRDDVDLVLVTTEPTRHATFAIRALESGRHVLVDKPVATTADDARRVAAAASASSAVAAYVHRLFSPALERLRAHVASGALGVPRSLELTWIAANAVEDEGGEVVVDPALSGGGELWNFLGYPLDTALWLTGLSVLSVGAAGTAAASEPHRRHGVESLATVTIELEAGVHVAIAVGRGPAVGGGVFAASVAGSHGYAAVDELRPSLDLAVLGGGGADFNGDHLFALTFGRLLDDVAAAIERGGTLRRTLQEGCTVASVVAAACSSAARGARQTVQ